MTGFKADDMVTHLGMDREEAEAMERQHALADEMVKQGQPFITALIMAGDQVSAERWEKRMAEKGMTPEQTASLIGSYSRFGWALKNCSREWFREHIADLWRGSDPDDTDPKFLAAWVDAWEANGHKTITDGKALPRRKYLTLYRGQMPNDPIGIAWSLDRDIADKFARGAGIRAHDMPGAILEVAVPRNAVLGYLTGRGESECVVLPQFTTHPKIVAQYTRQEAADKSLRVKRERQLAGKEMPDG